MESVTHEIRRAILREHPETVRAVCEAGNDLTSTLEEPILDGQTIRVPLETVLDRRGLLEELVSVLRTAARTTDVRIRGTPVPAPPTVVVTSRGPLCRATLSDGRRLLVEIKLFTLSSEPRQYQSIDASPSEALRVRFVT